MTDGDRFRLESGERIRIAGIDAAETHRDWAKCAEKIVLESRAKDRAMTLLVGRDVAFHRVGRSYDRTVTTAVLDSRDFGAELVRHRVSQHGRHAVGPSRSGAVDTLIPG